MSDLCVFTTGTDLDLLRQSCVDVGIALQTYEVHPHKGYTSTKIDGAIKFLKSRTEPYVMWVDGHDSLVLKPESDIFDRLGECDNSCLISAEMTCWPDSDLAELYSLSFRCVPRYINAGGYIGPRSVIIQTLETILAGALTEDDQREWTRAYLAGLIPNVGIDHARLIFASIGDGEAALHADSCVKHWNGRVPGRQEYYDAR